MKEVTYEEWQKNPKPRMMWVWDYDIRQKLKTTVLYIMEGSVGYPVVAQNEMQCRPVLYVHCAEIEESKKRWKMMFSVILRQKKFFKELKIIGRKNEFKQSNSTRQGTSYSHKRYSETKKLYPLC